MCIDCRLDLWRAREGARNGQHRGLRVDTWPFFNLPAVGRSRWDQGLTAAEMKRCHWVKPIMVCQIKFTEWTRDDRLRQPVFLGIREDKNAKEVKREKAS
jgi:bifunctional non-homologous end joining protein LigD